MVDVWKQSFNGRCALKQKKPEYHAVSLRHGSWTRPPVRAAFVGAFLGCGSAAALDGPPNDVPGAWEVRNFLAK